nr:MAG TPA: hypothetical protein [Caudoviricetes sp.]
MELFKRFDNSCRVLADVISYYAYCLSCFFAANQANHIACVIYASKRFVIFAFCPFCNCRFIFLISI